MNMRMSDKTTNKTNNATMVANAYENSILCVLYRGCVSGCFALSLSCGNKVNQIYKTKSVFKKPLKSLTTKNNCCLRGFTSTSRSIFNPEGSA